METNSHPPKKPFTLSPSWQRKNARRIELIRKSNREGLSADEQREYERVEEEFTEHLNSILPPPQVDLDRLNQIKKRLTTAEEKSIGSKERD